MVAATAVGDVTDARLRRAAPRRSLPRASTRSESARVATHARGFRAVLRSPPSESPRAALHSSFARTACRTSSAAVTWVAPRGRPGGRVRRAVLALGVEGRAGRLRDSSGSGDEPER